MSEMASHSAANHPPNKAMLYPISIKTRLKTHATDGNHGFVESQNSKELMSYG